MRISPEDPSWTAPVDRDDWRDDNILLASAWLSSFVDRRTWERRLAAVRSYFLEARQQWASGNLVPLYDPRDTIAWYLFQANAYAQDRQDWVPDEAVRIAPTLTRIARDLRLLPSIVGVEQRAARLMTYDKGQPDGGLYEILVSLAYRRAGWDVSFVPEEPGRGRRPDLLVKKGRRRWAAECKRMERSAYHLEEQRVGRNLSSPVHRLALEAYRPLVVLIDYQVELSTLPEDYLSRRARDYLEDDRNAHWADQGGFGQIFEIDWRLFHSVIAKDSVYFGSSRMIELLLGAYDHDLDYDFSGRWRPDHRRHFWADALYHASVTCWRSSSREAVSLKSMHFNRIVAGAARQLPAEQPGVVHVGVETWGGKIVDGLRNWRNLLAMRSFDPKGGRLRWVYANYIAPEVSTRSNESWAIEETMAYYRIGNHQTAQPLPHHTLFCEPSASRDGTHWD